MRGSSESESEVKASNLRSKTKELILKAFHGVVTRLFRTRKHSIKKGQTRCVIPNRKSKRSPKKQTSSADNESSSDSNAASPANENIAKTIERTKNKKGRMAKSEYSNSNTFFCKFGFCAD